MLPKTRQQKKIMRISNSLPAITENQTKYCQEHTFKKFAHYHKSAWCSECGGTFNASTEDYVICPHCQSKLKTNFTKKWKFREKEYFTICTTKDNLQVLRHFMVHKITKRNLKAEYLITECVQNIIDKEVYHVARKVKPYPHYYDDWDMRTNLELRSYTAHRKKYDIFPKAIKYERILPIYIRNGFRKDIITSPSNIFRNLMIPQYETIVKANQIKLAEGYDLVSDNIKKYWESIKICIRNNYLIDDCYEYFDYLDMLVRLGKDIRNAKYICPEDFKKEHDKCSDKLRRILRKKADIALRKQAKLDEKEFQEKKNKYFGLEIANDTIKLKVLSSIDEYIKESEIMKHCVLSNKYYLKDDTLILTAIKNDKHLETVEVSLKDYKVIQSRGRLNSTTEYHEEIIDLVNNSKLIRKRKYGHTRI